MKIPFLNLEPAHKLVKEEMAQAFESTYASNWFVMGNKLENFEAQYAAFNETKHAIGVSNGLDALVLSLLSLGIGPGDEVIVPSHTYIASVLAISYVGATPVFVEPDERTFNLNPANIGAAITSSTKAVMPVHMYGQACNMTAICKIARERDLYIVEDNAQAHGARYDGKITGSIGDMSGTSFYPGKNLGALGDGGMITTNSERWADQASMLRNYGSSVKYKHERIGYNMRLDELQAAFLSVKLKRLDLWTTQRRTIAEQYSNLLAEVGDLILPFTDPRSEHVFHLYVVRTQYREQLRDHLQMDGIQTLVHYPIPIHLQEAYAHLGHESGDFPIAEKIAECCLSLPLWPGMDKREVAEVATSVSRFFESVK